MQADKYLWLVTTRDPWGEHPMVVMAGETLDKKEAARRLSLPYQPRNGKTLANPTAGEIKRLTGPLRRPNRFGTRISKTLPGGIVI